MPRAEFVLTIDEVKIQIRDVTQPGAVDALGHILRKTLDSFMPGTRAANFAAKEIAKVSAGIVSLATNKHKRRTDWTLLRS